MDKIYKMKEFAKIVKVSLDTLRNWDNNGKLKAHRTPAGHRFYTDYHLNKFIKDGENMILSGYEIKFLNYNSKIKDITYGFNLKSSNLIKKIYRTEIDDFLKIDQNKNNKNFIKLLNDETSIIAIDKNNDIYYLIAKSNDCNEFEKIMISTDFFKLLITFAIEEF